MSDPLRVSRRKFVQQGAGSTAAMLAAPFALAAPSAARAARPAASDRVVVGLIGPGDFGRRQHLKKLLLPNPRVRVAAVADVDQLHREQAALDVQARTGQKISIYKDFRDLLDRPDIDAVVIAVPDHWHALAAIAALEAGKDVYCEKPLSLTIEQGRAMVAAARRYGRVFQTGSQQRSDTHYFRQAHELVRSGAIGRLTKVAVHIGGGPAGVWQRPQTPPPSLDWNFWLGPAPYVDYTPNRCHYLFRWFADYSGGSITDHGAHQNDIAQWIIGADDSGPTKVEGTGTFHENGPSDVPARFHVEFTYGRHGNVPLIFTSDPSPRGGNLEIYGTDGWLSVSRRRILAEHPEVLTADPLPHDYQARLTDSYVRHYANWLDCIQSRERPVCDVEIGHRSATICHLAGIALRLRRPLNWDPTAEEFIDDAPANRLLNRPMRGPWHL
ncbi:MAG TPA: Gfo/Idh/MocA family oxidoreductase [Pirellulales bacterium]|jgi:predicted dehydrogenase|nr:Gfo/Idh/MocA family oxidoreductase [Pirellulales bacterium]